MTGELTFFEIGVADTARARAFYSELFGWRLEPGPSGNGYRISTPTIPGGMHGDDEEAGPLVYFDVADLEGAMARVRELGGQAEALQSRADGTRERRSSDASRSATTTRAPPSGSTSRPRRRTEGPLSPPPAGRR